MDQCESERAKCAVAQEVRARRAPLRIAVPALLLLACVGHARQPADEQAGSDPGRASIASLNETASAVAQPEPPSAEQSGVNAPAENAPQHQPVLGITAEEDALSPPGPPGAVSVAHQGQLHVVEWRGTGDDTIIGYELYRRCPSQGWVAIGRLPLHPDDERNRGTYRFEDKLDADCEYTVAAIAPGGKPGPKSADI